MVIALPLAKKFVGLVGGGKGYPRKTFSTCETSGRTLGSWPQQLCIVSHNSSEHAGWAGRGGRSPRIMAVPAIPGLLTSNGGAPVKTCVETERRLRKAQRITIHPRRTSTMTIANEKTSASLLYVPESFAISGAVHCAV